MNHPRSVPMDVVNVGVFFLLLGLVFPILPFCRATEDFQIDVFAPQTNTTETDDDDICEPDYWPWTPNLFRIISWLPRITGSITVLSSLGMISMAWRRRDRVFHRLIFGMSIHILIVGIWCIVGGWAVPTDENPSRYDEAGYWWYWKPDKITMTGYYGTTATCTAQGFFIFVCAHSAMLYYSLLSVYSYVGITNNYQRDKYAWIEKYIHVSANLLPLACGLAFLYLDAYNYPFIGVCYVTGDLPMGCEIPGHKRECVSCVRGPSTKGVSNFNSYFLATIPELLILAIPTVVMVTLYFKVKRNQSAIYVIQAKSFARQTTVYLAAVYFITLPVLLIYTRIVPEGWFSFHVFAFVVWQVFGLWIGLTYLYFTVPKKIEPVGDGDAKDESSSDSQLDPSVGGPPKPSSRSRKPPALIFSLEESDALDTTALDKTAAQEEHASNDVINQNAKDENSSTVAVDANSSTAAGDSRNSSTAAGDSRNSRDTSHNKTNKDNTNNNDGDNDSSSPESPPLSSPKISPEASWFQMRKWKSVMGMKTKPMGHDGEVPAARNRSSTPVPVRKYSFNIFDGTNASGGFADFIFEGDESDEASDERDTEYWAGMQGL